MNPSYPATPTFETERLRFRGHTREDFAASAAMWADPIVTRYIGGRPFTRQETWAKVLRYIGHWSVLGYGYWVACDRVSGAFVGEVGFADFQRDLVPPLDAPEIGWVLTPAAHGRGLATEAVRAAVAWGDRHLPGKRTVCMIAPEHAASIRVAEKAGYRGYGLTDYMGEPCALFERTAP